MLFMDLECNIKTESVPLPQQVLEIHSLLLLCCIFSHLPPGEQRRSGPEIPPKNLLVKPGQSGLRPPGFSALPAARLAAFGFVRSSSVSSVSSNQSNDSSHSDACRASQCESCCLCTFHIRLLLELYSTDQLKRAPDKNIPCIRQIVFSRSLGKHCPCYTELLQ